MTRPLQGITVLGLTHMLSGPYGTMTLTGLGVRTIKVEPPGRAAAKTRVNCSVRVSAKPDPTRSAPRLIRWCRAGAEFLARWAF